MAYKIEITDSFERDLGRAIDYHIDVLHAELAAENLMSKLDETIGLLASNPDIKAVSSKPILKDARLREWLVKNYVLVYSFDGTVVRFERFFHQSQNFEDLLRQ